MRLIKRYRNRRLYDTGASRTITQTELATMIKQGTDIKVVDHTTEEDITLEVLGRVMTKQAAGWGKGTETKRLFSQIIQLGGEKTMSILKNTVLASIGAFQVTKEKAEKIIDDLIKRGDLQESQRKTAVLELLDKAEKSTAGWRQKISREATKASQEVSKLASELKKYKMAKQTDLKKLEEKVDRLSKAIDAIEKRLAEL